MNTKQKNETRICGLQKKLERTALLQRNYQRHYKKINPKYEKDSILYTNLLNTLRKELEVIKVTEKAATNDHIIKTTVNVVAIGEETVIVG